MNDCETILRNGIGRSGLPNEKELIYAAIEKQIPQAPILCGSYYFDFEGNKIFDFWHCPNCDTAYETETQYKYCPWCGQKLNWEEREGSEE